MGSYDQLTAVSMTITAPIGAGFFDPAESAIKVVRRFVRDDIDFTVDVKVSPAVGRYEATVDLWPKP